MPDHIAYMLDSMISAVDESLSYDGIVSLPEAGLEDVKPKTCLADSLRDGVDRARITGVAISRGASRAASVLKPKRHQHHDNPGHRASERIDREKNSSEESPAHSDELPDMSEEKLITSSLPYSGTDERNHFAREQVAAQPYRDETDTVSRCFQRPCANRAYSEPISGKGTRLLRAGNAEEWQLVSPVGTPGEEFPENNGAERHNWRTRFKPGGSQGKKTKSVPLPDANNEPMSEGFAKEKLEK